MLLVYNLGVRLYYAAVALSSPFNTKAKLWIQGREGLPEKLRATLKPGEKRVWFHCASLGEFEQGRPVIESFRQRYPGYRIVLTFFSPSGYEIRKNYDKADYVFYLPLDTRSNAEEFIQLVQPEKAFFIKYEFWYHYIKVLSEKGIPTYLVSAIFRDSQVFFRWYGTLFRHLLEKVTWFFVQNQHSQELLQSIGIRKVTISGDTRFDRVSSIAAGAGSLPVIESFKNGEKLFVAGSTWDKDEKMLIAFLQHPTAETLKVVIAPHEIHPASVTSLQSAVASLPGRKVARYSEITGETTKEYNVLIIDNIGMLSGIYSYADFAYIGGGFGKGIHNILEAAVFGPPVFFGPNYRKFQEALDLVDAGGAFPVSSQEDLTVILSSLLGDSEACKKILSRNKSYIQERIGATSMIIEKIAEA